jgi:hypothetical protein
MRRFVAAWVLVCFGGWLIVLWSQARDAAPCKGAFVCLSPVGSTWIVHVMILAFCLVGVAVIAVVWKVVALASASDTAAEVTTL